MQSSIQGSSTRLAVNQEAGTEHPMDVALGELATSAQRPPSIDQSLAQEQDARLIRVIEGEIIPRLMLAHQELNRRARAAREVTQTKPEPIHVEEFARTILAADVDAANAYVELMRSAGMTLDALYLDLLAPAAQHLGELWLADLCDFSEVTVALWRLQQMLHEFSPAFRSEARALVDGWSALLAPAPGEHHTLGLSMIAELFRRAGWNVWGGAPSSSDQLLRIVREHWFEMIGFSTGSQCRLDVLRQTIIEVRRASRNPHVAIMVGGPIFVQEPELATCAGADGTAADARAAVDRAEQLVRLRQRRV